MLGHSQLKIEFFFSRAGLSYYHLCENVPREKPCSYGDRAWQADLLPACLLALPSPSCHTELQILELLISIKITAS